MTKETIKGYKLRNMLDMAYSFSAMSRVFKAGVKEEIIAQLKNNIGGFLNCSDLPDYEKKHKKFCNDFIKNLKIRTAQRKRKGKIIKKSQNVSYGEAAKVLDIALKVFVYYCGLSKSLDPKWLYLPIDNNVLHELKKHKVKYKLQETLKGVSGLSDINEKIYHNLQKAMCDGLYFEMIGEHYNVSKKRFDKKPLISYDDVIWAKLKH